MAETISHDLRWQEYGADEWSDALVQAMKLGGVEHLFFVSGPRLLFGKRAWPEPKKRDGQRPS